MVRWQLEELLLIVILGEVVQHLVLVKLVLLELLHLGLHCPHALHEVVQPILASCQGDGGWFSEGSLDGKREGDVCGR